MAVHVLMNPKVLQEQLNIIMGALTKAAVVEICEVVDEGYAVLQLEISRSRQENEDLRKKLHLIESIIVRGGGGGGSSGAKALTWGGDSAAFGGGGGDTADTPPRDGDDVSAAVEDSNAVRQEEFPDVVLIKDEDSDSNDDSCGESAKMSSEGGSVGVWVDRDAARSKKRVWPSSNESACPETKMDTLKTPASKLSMGKRKKGFSQYTLDSPSHDPGCSSQLGGGLDKEAGDTVCSYGAQMDPDLHLVLQERTLVPPMSSSSRHVATYFGGHGNKALMEFQANKAELDLSLSWTKPSKSQMAFPPPAFHPSETSDSEPFGLKLISVTGSTSTDCHLSESSNSAFEFNDSDVMNFTGLYRDPSGQHGDQSASKGKRFVCGICSKNYATSQNLDVHMRIHTGQRPFSCSQCGKNFTQSAHLKSHLSVHTGERPFTCALCSKSFIVKYSLKLHMKKCHGVSISCDGMSPSPL